MANYRTFQTVGFWFPSKGKTLTIFSPETVKLYVFAQMAILEDEETGRIAGDANQLNDDGLAPSDCGGVHLVTSIDEQGMVIITDIPDGMLFYVTDSADGDAVSESIFEDTVDIAFC